MKTLLLALALLFATPALTAEAYITTGKSTEQLVEDANRMTERAQALLARSEEVARPPEARKMRAEAEALLEEVSEILEEIERRKERQ